MATTLRASDLAVFDGLSIVKLDGYEPEADEVELEDGSVIDRNAGIDCPGSANWLLTQYGMQPDDFDPETKGVLWCDLDNSEWRFSALLASDEVEDFTRLATEAGYEVLGVEPITEPTTYGDSHAGVVTILKHPDGWVVLN